MPPPRLAWVEKNIDISQIVLDNGFHLSQPNAEGSEPLTTERYHQCNLLARRLVNYRSHYFHLKKTNKDGTIDGMTAGTTQGISTGQLDGLTHGTALGISDGHLDGLTSGTSQGLSNGHAGVCS